VRPLDDAVFDNLRKSPTGEKPGQPKPKDQARR
jgi:hypothetical protein